MPEVDIWAGTSGPHLGRKKPTKNKSATKRLKKYRVAAYYAQRGRCYWCGVQMLLVERNPFEATEAHDCTAEHLIPKAQGGTNAQANIVAACKACNCARKTDAWVPKGLWDGK